MNCPRMNCPGFAEHADMFLVFVVRFVPPLRIVRKVPGGPNLIRKVSAGPGVQISYNNG